MAKITKLKFPERSKQFRKPEKIEEILNAACRVLDKKGFADLSMNDIALEADVNKALLFYYFKKKEQLFIDLLRLLSQKYFDMISDIASLPISVEKKISLASKGFHKFMEDEPKWFLMSLELIVQAVHKPESKSEAMSLHKEAMSRGARVFKDARKSGEIKRPFDDNVLTSLTTATFIGLGVLKVIDNESTDFSKAHELFVNMVKTYLGSMK